jgi:hypothetical protein
VTGLVRCSLLAGVASFSVARKRNLSPLQAAVAFPLGIAIYLVTEIRSKAGVS